MGSLSGIDDSKSPGDQSEASKQESPGDEAEEGGSGGGPKSKRVSLGMEVSREHPLAVQSDIDPKSVIASRTNRGHRKVELQTTAIKNLYNQIVGVLEGYSDSDIPTYAQSVRHSQLVEELHRERELIAEKTSGLQESSKQLLLNKRDLEECCIKRKTKEELAHLPSLDRMKYKTEEDRKIIAWESSYNKVEKELNESLTQVRSGLLQLSDIKAIIKEASLIRVDKLTRALRQTTKGEHIRMLIREFLILNLSEGELRRRLDDNLTAVDLNGDMKEFLIHYCKLELQITDVEVMLSKLRRKYFNFGQDTPPKPSGFNRQTPLGFSPSVHNKALTQGTGLNHENVDLDRINDNDVGANFGGSSILSPGSLNMSPSPAKTQGERNSFKSPSPTKLGLAAGSTNLESPTFSMTNQTAGMTAAGTVSAQYGTNKSPRSPTSPFSQALPNTVHETTAFANQTKRNSMVGSGKSPGNSPGRRSQNQGGRPSVGGPPGGPGATVRIKSKETDGRLSRRACVAAFLEANAQAPEQRGKQLLNNIEDPSTRHMNRKLDTTSRRERKIAKLRSNVTTTYLQGEMERGNISLQQLSDLGVNAWESLDPLLGIIVPEAPSKSPGNSPPTSPSSKKPGTAPHGSGRASGTERGPRFASRGGMGFSPPASAAQTERPGGPGSMLARPASKEKEKMNMWDYPGPASAHRELSPRGPSAGKRGRPGVGRPSKTTELLHNISLRPGSKGGKITKGLKNGVLFENDLTPFPTGIGADGILGSPEMQLQESQNLDTFGSISPSAQRAHRANILAKLRSGGMGSPIHYENPSSMPPPSRQRPASTSYGGVDINDSTLAVAIRGGCPTPPAKDPPLPPGWTLQKGFISSHDIFRQLGVAKGQPPHPSSIKAIIRQQIGFLKQRLFELQNQKSDLRLHMAKSVWSRESVRESASRSVLPVDDAKANGYKVLQLVLDEAFARASFSAFQDKEEHYSEIQFVQGTSLVNHADVAKIKRGFVHDDY